ncbi:MAG: hypothetical protein DCF12_21110 [Snowella sp.]|nr:MAG: hypothetical protein DCF12_21110 [Snowella sp.]
MKIFFINDGSNQNIEGKGSGLQRLAYILLHYRIIEKTKSKSVIFMIDEPDIYLHQDLQKKLLRPLKKLTEKAQIFVTTHSPAFIDSYTLDNVYLLELKITQTYYKRRNREFNILETKAVEIDSTNGTRKIRNYLGIEDLDYELLDSYNVIVEGSSDKFYIENLCHFFGLTVPKIINANGADNIIKYLDFYQSFYQNRNNKPCLLVLLDNNNKGREIYLKIKPSRYSKLGIHKQLLPNFMGETHDDLNIKYASCDWQVEDFVYPSVLCELVNIILKKRGTNLRRDNLWGRLFGLW